MSNQAAPAPRVPEHTPTLEDLGFTVEGEPGEFQAVYPESMAESGAMYDTKAGAWKAIKADILRACNSHAALVELAEDRALHLEWLKDPATPKGLGRELSEQEEQELIELRDALAGAGAA